MHAKSKPTAKKKKNTAKQLLYKPASAWEDLPAATKQTVGQYAERYKQFLRHAKTERESIQTIELALRKLGYVEIGKKARLRAGDRVYKSIKGRAMIAAQVQDPTKPWRIVGAHVDSPRLDLKPLPLFEDSQLAMLKTHYYGGIKKYQWVNVPLSMHARVHTTGGVKEFILGEKPGEPQFIIPDMPPHLGREQMGKHAKDVITGEQLRIVVGNQPLKTKEADKVKLAVLDLLHRRYGLVEKDLLSADIAFVPAGHPVDIGFDQSMIAAYGQDDRACAFALLEAMQRIAKPKGVALALWVDKEETGSQGDTGAQSQLLENFSAQLLRLCGATLTAGEVLEQATAISADVTEALNPNFKEISDAQNSSRMGGGISVEKYGGGGGKYDTNEASGEYMHWLTQLFDRAGIAWQTGEFGRLDLGGGGTIAMYLSRYGMDTIDAGPPLLSMHSPHELASKLDVYLASRGYEEFLKS